MSISLCGLQLQIGLKSIISFDHCACFWWGRFISLVGCVWVYLLGWFVFNGFPKIFGRPKKVKGGYHYLFRLIYPNCRLYIHIKRWVAVDTHRTLPISDFSMLITVLANKENSSFSSFEVINFSLKIWCFLKTKMIHFPCCVGQYSSQRWKVTPEQKVLRVSTAMLS